MGSASDTPPPSPATRASVLVRKTQESTRGATLSAPRRDPPVNRVDVNHIFTNEASIAFSYDYFETGLGDGPGTWPSLADDTVAVLRNQAVAVIGKPGGPINEAQRCRFRSLTRHCRPSSPTRRTTT